MHTQTIVKTDPRHEARKLALASIFCWTFSDSQNDLCLDLSKSLLGGHELNMELTNTIVEGVQKNCVQIDAVIIESAPEWPVDKISKMDLAILRIAVFEILFGKNVPEKVAIDEAVELAKEFGSDSSSKFVNGVLGNVISLKKAENE